MPSYLVAENNGSVNVCAVITELPVGGYEVEINVFLTSINGTNAGLLKQTGKNINIFKNVFADIDRDFVFNASSQFFTFSHSETSFCIDVVIIDDDDVEGDHEFELMISHISLETIILPSSFTTITINDTAGRSKLK